MEKMKSLNLMVGDDVEVVVYYEYAPAEKQTLEYPGCEARIEISGVYLKADEGSKLPAHPVDILSLIDDSIFDEIEQEIWYALEGYGDDSPRDYADND